MNFTESHWSVDLIPMNGSLPEMAPDDSGFDLTNRMEHQAKPICNDKSLNLALDCDNCDAGYPKVDLCIQWTESQTQNGSFKVNLQSLKYKRSADHQWLIWFPRLMDP